MRNLYFNSLFSVIIFSGLTACAVGPNFNRPSKPESENYSVYPVVVKTQAAAVTQGEAQEFNQSRDIPYDWWTLFHSEQINALIERALKNNPDIQTAQASVLQAQELANAQRGMFFPSVSASYTPSRNKVAGNMSTATPGPQANGDVLQETAPQATYYNFHVSQLNVGFVPDVFGLNRREVESADALTAAQKFQLHAAQITLATHVFSVAIEQALLQTEIESTKNIVASNEELLEIIRKQLKRGLVSALDVAAQENALAAAKQTLIPLELQLQKNHHLLAALQGDYPDRAFDDRIKLDALNLPQELPLSLPSTLVEQRPDVRAAEEQLHYASAQTGVAIANRFPQFNISGAIGGMADTPNWMFKSGGSFFNLSANITDVIFDGGVLRAKSRAAKAALTAAGAQYRSTVITAIQNVADTLLTLQSDALALNVAAAAAHASKESVLISRKQFDLGAINYQTLLVAEQNDQQAQINLSQAQAARLIDTAALYQSLGGGWWNKTSFNE